jgi:hypothetical protein
MKNVYAAGRNWKAARTKTGNWRTLLSCLSLAAGLGHRSGDQGQVACGRLRAATRTDTEASLRVAAAGIQAVLAEVVTALVAAQQALPAHAGFAMVADGNAAPLHQVQLTPINEWCFAGEIQRNHGKSIETWKLLPVAST